MTAVGHKLPEGFLKQTILTVDPKRLSPTMQYGLWLSVGFQKDILLQIPRQGKIKGASIPVILTHVIDIKVRIICTIDWMFRF